MLWGLQLQANLRHSHQVPKGLRITKATLSTETPPAVAQSQDPASKYVEVFVNRKGQDYPIAILKHGEHHECYLDLHFPEGEDICLHLRGEGVVSLSGQILPTGDANDAAAKLQSRSAIERINEGFKTVLEISEAAPATLKDESFEELIQDIIVGSGPVAGSVRDEPQQNEELRGARDDVARSDPLFFVGGFRGFHWNDSCDMSDRSNRNTFWGLEFEAKVRWWQKVPRGFRLTQVTLNTETPPAVARSQDPASKYVEVFVDRRGWDERIAILKHGECYEHYMDLCFTEGEDIYFYMEGEGVVFLSGHIPYPDDLDDAASKFQTGSAIQRMNGDFERVSEIPEAAPASLTNESVKELIVEDNTVGSGPVAERGMTVEVYYICKLLNGKTLASWQTGDPFRFMLGDPRAIRGLSMGIEGMRVGGKRRLIIPANLALGHFSTNVLPARSALQCEVELKGVESAWNRSARNQQEELRMELDRLARSRPLRFDAHRRMSNRTKPWCIELETNVRHGLKVTKALQVTKVMLQLRYLRSPDPAMDFVEVFVDRDGSESLVARLEHGGEKILFIDLRFAEGENICFYLKGEGIVALCGHILNPDGADDAPWPWM